MYTKPLFKLVIVWHIFRKLRFLSFHWRKPFQDTITTSDTIIASVRPPTKEQTVTKLRHEVIHWSITWPEQPSKIFIITSKHTHRLLLCLFKFAFSNVSNLLRVLHNNPNSNLNIAAILVSKWWLHSDLLIYTSFEPIGGSTGYNSQWESAVKRKCLLLFFHVKSHLQPIVLMFQLCIYSTSVRSLKATRKTSVWNGILHRPFKWQL